MSIDRMDAAPIGDWLAGGPLRSVIAALVDDQAVAGPMPVSPDPVQEPPTVAAAFAAIAAGRLLDTVADAVADEGSPPPQAGRHRAPPLLLIVLRRPFIAPGFRSAGAGGGGPGLPRT